MRLSSGPGGAGKSAEALVADATAATTLATSLVALDANIQVMTAAIAASPAGLIDLTDGVVADSTAQAARVAGDVALDADIQVMTVALAASAAGLKDIADGVVADSTALQALRLGEAGPLGVAVGSGANGALQYASRVEVLQTGLHVTQILVDISGLISDATDNVAIGETGGQANAHFGRLTVADCGVIFAGSVECFEVPAGGEPDLDFFGDNSGTIAEGADGSTDNSLLDRGADWVAGDLKYMTGNPDADDYLYITVGKGSGDSSEYSAGIFLITFYGK